MILHKNRTIFHFGSYPEFSYFSAKTVWSPFWGENLSKCVDVSFQTISVKQINKKRKDVKEARRKKNL